MEIDFAFKPKKKAAEKCFEERVSKKQQREETPL